MPSDPASTSPAGPASGAAPGKVIRVRGAREHNLKSLEVEIPRDRLVVITGVSGSGKSSLAFDTIFAEGQRKYMESLSAYARQFLNQMQKPDVEEIEGLPPTIAIEQRSGGHTPRSTVATTTEIYDYLRLLYARCGTPTCWATVGTGKSQRVCGQPITATPASQIVEAVLQRAAGRRTVICAPIVRAKKGFHREAAEGLQKQGFVRARVNGEIVDLREKLKETGENPLGLGRYEMHSIEAVVDRLVPDDATRQRLAESVEVALRLGEGSLIVLVETDGAWSEHRFSERLSCPDHPECSIDELEPRLFSFNSPHGACPMCAGLGTVSEFDLDLVIPDREASLAEGTIEPWRKNGPRMNMWYARMIRRFCEATRTKSNTPFAKLPKATARMLLDGTTEADEKKLGFSFEGVLPNLRRRYENSESQFVKERLHGYMSNRPCTACGGMRLRPEALAVRLRSGTLAVNVGEVAAMTIEQAAGLMDTLDLTREQRSIAEPILREIQARLGFMSSVGLNYLTLDRASATLSGGEAQRIRLATQVGSGLVGVCYVLDEPTIGLHQRDNDRLIATLRRLADIGNTVLVVEHDEDMIRSADHVLDIGPGPGRHGGTVVAQGAVADIVACPASLTGRYLSGERGVRVPAQRRALGTDCAVVVKGARANNLKSIDVAFPLGGIVCVTGVSGSGKSTLVNDILLKAALKSVQGSRVSPGAHDRVNGLNKVDRIVEVDQSPIGRTPRSNPATYTGIFDEIRRLFAQTKESKIRGYEPGRFSFNVKGGRCEACQGQGVKKIEMHFLPDVFVTCEVCKGTRYNRETLDVHFKGRNIAQILDMTVDDALLFFEAHPRVHRMIECLHDVGLDYMQLGQASTTLSGGEAQRVKLASELGSAPAGHTLYLLDEPTTGLHFADVEKLLGVLNRLADAGHTLVVIEHNLDVIKFADWIIDLGPEGGDRGGTVVASGTPEEVAANDRSYTGHYLKPLLRTTAKQAAKGGRRKAAAAR
ncbi:MAG: excinuclease ABC subunit UvrA [Phycisphaerales bacterium]|nr:excinuclease ABC subunit UvrA [Phycisphaerales bacterium]